MLPLQHCQNPSATAAIYIITAILQSKSLHDSSCVRRTRKRFNVKINTSYDDMNSTTKKKPTSMALRLFVVHEHCIFNLPKHNRYKNRLSRYRITVDKIHMALYLHAGITVDADHENKLAVDCKVVFCISTDHHWNGDPVGITSKQRQKRWHAQADCCKLNA
jgi:hypothetical protein